jgi:hypothetical protein
MIRRQSVLKPNTSITTSNSNLNVYAKFVETKESDLFEINKDEIKYKVKKNILIIIILV